MLGNKGEAIKKRKDELLGIKKQDGNALFEEICEYKDITVQHGQINLASCSFTIR